MRIIDWSSDVCSSYLVGQHLLLLYRNGLDPNVERAGLACCIDPCSDEAENLVKYPVLQSNRQREDAIEPALDGWQVIDHPAVGPFDPEPAQFLKPGQSNGFELAREQQAAPPVSRGKGDRRAWQRVGRKGRDP